MDGLALNIFVPESKTSKSQKSQRVKPSETVVKSLKKAQDTLNKKTFQKRPSQQPGQKPTKPAFIKAKIGKKEANFQPFRISEQFNKSKTSVNEASNDEEEGFSVSFVKPKLFQKKKTEQKPKEPNTSIETHKNPPKDEESTVKEAKVVTFDRDVGRKSNFWKPKVEKVAQNVGFDREKVAKKWFGTASSDQKVRIDFPLVKKKEHVRNVETLNSKSVDIENNRRSEVNTDPSVSSDEPQSGLVKERKVTKRKWAESEPDYEKSHQNVQGSKGAKWKKNAIQDGGSFSKPWKDSSEVHANRSVGPISSLFNSEPSVEKLEDVDIEPLEERLFSRKTFRDVGIHPHLVGNLEQLFGITNMTVVQKKTLPILIAGQDALVRSQTGSGKTLAYAIPIMHALQGLTPKLTRKDGVKALVVLPTRELALQTYECFTKLMRAFTWIVPGIVVGGEKRTSEKARLRKGINVLVGTPGRLLDHAEHTENLNLHGIDWLIIDEADKLLEMGYEKDVSQLINIIDTQRQNSDVSGRKQTVLLSATLTSAVERLASLTLNEPAHIDACTNVQETANVLVIPQSLQQRYVVVPAKLRLVALASYLIDVAELQKSNKILVFMATQDMVDYYLELLQGVLTSSVKFYKLHGNMSQTDRTEVFNRFRSSDKGVLFSTDVAARGLDLPKVDWIVQFTAPTTPAEYVHRVGRTARVGSTGSALLFLLPSELHFVSMLNSSRIKLDEVSVDKYLKSLMKIHLESKDGQRWGGGVEGAATVLQHNFENSVINDPDLHQIACKAYKSWVRFYATYPKDLRVVFDFKSLHLGHNAKSFALRDPPRAIGGIGKPQKGQKLSRDTEKRARKRKMDLGHVTSSSRTKQLITSEFDSGLKPIRKMK